MHLIIVILAIALALPLGGSKHMGAKPLTLPKVGIAIGSAQRAHGLHKKPSPEYNGPKSETYRCSWCFGALGIGCMGPCGHGALVLVLRGLGASGTWGYRSLA